MKLQNNISAIMAIVPITVILFKNCGNTLLQSVVNFHNIVFGLFYKTNRQGR